MRRVWCPAFYPSFYRLACLVPIAVALLAWPAAATAPMRLNDLSSREDVLRWIDGYRLRPDPGAVVLCPPADPYKTPTQFLAEVGLLYVRPDVPARIIINERTGTIVAGENVSLSPAAVAHGNLYIGVSLIPVVSQPVPLSGGTTVTGVVAQVYDSEQHSRLIPVPQSTTVAEVARSLNALGVTPRDLISIFQAMKSSGHLHAELVIE